MAKSLCYTGKLLELKPGHLLSITGKTLDRASYFDFFLGSDNGTSEDFGDIQFHCAVNFTGTGDIVRNSFTEGIGWETLDERAQNLLPSNSKNSIVRGGVFKISIYCDLEMFYMTIDEKPYCTYKYRKPLKDVKRLNVFGDVEQIYQVSHQIANPDKVSPATAATFNGSIPIITPDTAIVFFGSCHGQPVGSTGHLVMTFIENGTSTVLLQIIANFNNGEIIGISQDGTESLSLKVIGKPEEFPFVLNQNFRAAIGVTSNAFVLSVNGHHVLAYPFENNSFFGHQLSFQVTTCDGLEAKIHGVDVFEMEPGKSLESLSQGKNANEVYDYSRLLAQIHHK